MKKSKRLVQGDVILKRIPKMPEGERKEHNLTLALGESTGHHHTITSVKTGTLSAIKVFTIGNQMYVEAPVECELTHQEHGPITIDPGIYQIDLTREYSHFDEEARYVAD